MTFRERSIVSHFAISQTGRWDAIYRPEEAVLRRGTDSEGRRVADLFKSRAVGLTRVEPRKHTRFSLFSRDRAASRGEAGRRDAARRIVRSSVVLSSRVEGIRGVSTSVGTFEKHHRSCAECSRPIPGTRVTHRPRPSASERTRDCSVPSNHLPRILGRDTRCFPFSSPEGEP